MEITNYSLKKINSNDIRSYFTFHNVPVSLANSIRRSMMSIVPTVTFNDTWYDDPALRSINITKNTSALHNEWLAHRLSLIPLKMYDHDFLKIQTKFDKEQANRHFDFVEPDKIPLFSLEIKNDLKVKDKRDNYGLYTVTQNDFILSNSKLLKTDDIHLFMPLDPYTNDPLEINKLKTNIMNEDDGEEVELTARPTVGIGKVHTRYNPTSTVTYEFVSNKNEDEVEHVFQQKLEYLNQERSAKKLEPFSEKEIEKMRSSFNILDKQRVYPKNDKNQPIDIAISVESNGFLPSNQIMYDSMVMLKYMIKDLVHCLEIDEETLIVKSNSYKIEINETSSDRLGFNYLIYNENHTIGNLLADFMKNYFCNSDEFKEEAGLLKYDAYQMVHPLQEKIYIAMIPEDLSKTHKVRIIQRGLGHIFQIKPTELKYADLLKTINELEDADLNRLFCTIVFIRTTNIVIDHINTLIEKWSKLSNIKEPSFLIIDPEDYLDFYSIPEPLN
jgi:DNA-directed RNA polymerase alpha subunit